MIAAHGIEKTEEWAKGVVVNFARSPQGNDRDQIRAVAEGLADVAVVNTYYLGLLLSGSEEDRKVGEKVAVHFPNQSGRGTHINVSGAAIVRGAKNRKQAEQLIAYLLSPEAQRSFAEANHEYPVISGVEPSELVRSWGDFKEDTTILGKMGELGRDALKLADRAGWK